jgi:hypothetical protein
VSDKEFKVDTSLLETFFASVLGLQLNLEGLTLPVARPGLASMVKPAGLTSRELYEKISEHFEVIPGSWLKLEDKNVKLSCPQPRPDGAYVFSYRDRQFTDEEHIGMSQKEVAKIGLSFMTIPEYLLATAFTRFVRGEFLDLYTETILAEYWCYGGIPAGMVYGFHQHRGRNPEGHDPEGYNGLCLFNGPPEAKLKTCGPREVFL